MAHDDNPTGPEPEITRLEDFPGEIEEAPPSIEVGPIEPCEGPPLTEQEALRWNQRQAGAKATADSLATSLRQLAHQVAVATGDPEDLAARTSFDPCRNPACEFHAWCSVRPLAPQRKDSGGDRPAPPKAIEDDVCSSTFEFFADAEIGILRVRGRITSSQNPALEALATHRSRMQGLLVELCSGGGRSRDGDQLERAILETRLLMPVVSWVDCAGSAALLPALAGHRVLIAPDGVIGKAGSIQSICFGGEQPVRLVSALSPKKGGRVSSPWIYQPGPPDQAAIAQLQAGLDASHAKLVEAVCGYRGLSFDDALDLLDGSAFAADVALDAGLVDEVADQATAMKTLARLIADQEQERGLPCRAATPKPLIKRNTR